MNFDIIEGLNENQIKELYSEITVFNEHNSFIAGSYYCVTCDNGRSGCFYELFYYRPVGRGVYAAYSNCDKYQGGGCICNICGSNQWGYALNTGSRPDLPDDGFCRSGNVFVRC